MPNIMLEQAAAVRIGVIGRSAFLSPPAANVVARLRLVARKDDGILTAFSMVLFPQIIYECLGDVFDEFIMCL